MTKSFFFKTILIYKWKIIFPFGIEPFRTIIYGKILFICDIEIKTEINYMFICDIKMFQEKRRHLKRDFATNKRNKLALKELLAS